MPRFKQKPVEVEAYRMTRGGDVAAWPAWLKYAAELPRGTPGSMAKEGPEPQGRFQLVGLGGLEGVHTVSWGDWIIRGVQGELRPCKPEIFAATYDAVPSAPFERCLCGGEGFARFDARIELAGPRPDWLLGTQRITTACIDCTRKAVGLSGDMVEAAEAIAESSERQGDAKGLDA